MRKKLTSEEFYAATVEHWDQQRKEKVIIPTEALKDTVAEFYPCHSFYEICQEQREQYEGKWYFEEYDAMVMLEHKHLDLSIKFDNHKKKFKISCPSCWTKGRGATTWQLHKATVDAGIMEPNQIGVLSTKKIKEWISYYEKVFEVLKSLKAANGDKEREFRDSLIGLPVKYLDGDQDKGEISMNGLVFTFSIENGHVDQNIKIDRAVENTLDNFLKMVNGQPVKTRY